MSIFSTVNRGARGAVRAGRKTVRTTSNVVRGTGRELVKEGMRIAKNWQLELIKLCVFIVVLVITIIVVYVAVDNQLNTAQLIQYEPDLTFSSKQSFLKSFQLLKTNGTLYDEQATNAANLTVPDNINLDKSLWTQYAYDRNIEAYNLCAKSNTEEHIRAHQSPKEPSKMFDSFAKNYSPFTVLAFLSEWGGYTRYEYGLFPAIAYTEIVKSKYGNGMDLDPKITISIASADWYTGVLQPDTLTNQLMAGPLQIYTDASGEKSRGLNGFSTADYGYVHVMPWGHMKLCNYDADATGVLTTKFDPFVFEDACDFYAHFLSSYAAHARNKNYEFKSPEQVVVFTSAMVNTGPTFMVQDGSWFSTDTNGQRHSDNRFPWKNGDAIYAYVAEISKPENLEKIKVWARKNYDATLPKLKAKSTNYSENLQCDANEAFEFLKTELGVNPLDYTIGIHESGLEKVVHPVQAIWCYYQLIWFYTGEE